MTDIKDQINEGIKVAMRAKNKKRLAALRLINAFFKQKEIDDGIEINDTMAVVILDKMAKQHRDSIEQFAKAARNDLVEKEQYELDIIETYLPPKLSETEINKMIHKAISDTSAVSIKDMGKIMNALKPQLQGRADIGQVSKLIKAKLS